MILSKASVALLIVNTRSNLFLNLYLLEIFRFIILFIDLGSNSHPLQVYLLFFITLVIVHRASLFGHGLFLDCHTILNPNHLPDHSFGLAEIIDVDICLQDS